MSMFTLFTVLRKAVDTLFALAALVGIISCTITGLYIAAAACLFCASYFMLDIWCATEDEERHQFVEAYFCNNSLGEK